MICAGVDLLQCVRSVLWYWTMPCFSVSVGHRAGDRSGAGVAAAFVVEEEECLFFLIGPPTRAAEDVDQQRRRCTPERLLKKLLAAVSVPRRYSYSEPCISLVPDLVTSATSAPEPRPVAASPLVVVAAELLHRVQRHAQHAGERRACSDRSRRRRPA